MQEVKDMRHKDRGLELFLRWLPVITGLLSLAYSWGMISTEISSMRAELRTMIADVKVHESRISKIEGHIQP
jgi:hypothetical protein